MTVDTVGMKSDDGAMQTNDNLALGDAISPMVRWGVIIIGLFFFGLGGWAALAPLSSAAIATGVVSPDSSRKTVQHLEGGIIKDILVRDGDRVSVGQPLITLVDTQARASHRAVRSQWLRLSAMRERLQAQQKNSETLAFGEAMVREAAADAELSAFIIAQRELFETKHQAHSGRKSILRKQIAQLREEISGLNAQLVGHSEMLALIQLELEDLRQLSEKDLVRKSRLLRLQRSQAEIKSNIAAKKAEIARAQQKIGEINLSIINQDVEYRDALADELMRVNGQMAQLEERLAASGDVLTRTIIASPAQGTVVNLRYKTRGGVIGAGDPILEIVPAEDKLIIDARIQPIDIDVVHSGLAAQVHLLPYVARYTPAMEGEVVHVSADSLLDERTGERYYEAKIRVDSEKLKQVSPEIELAPGMPAEVMIVTGERSALMYVMEPIVRSFRRSFREQ